MVKDTIFYLYATWHGSIFDSFCGIKNAENTKFWDVLSNPSKVTIFAFQLCICVHICLNSNYKNILILKKKNFGCITSLTFIKPTHLSGGIHCNCNVD